MEREKWGNIKGLRLEFGFFDLEFQKLKLQNYGSRKVKREKWKEDVETAEVGSTKFGSSKVWKLESRKRKGESGSQKCRSRNSEMQKCISQKKVVF